MIPGSVERPLQRLRMKAQAEIETPRSDPGFPVEAKGAGFELPVIMDVEDDIRRIPYQDPVVLGDAENISLELQAQLQTAVSRSDQILYAARDIIVAP